VPWKGWQHHTNYRIPNRTTTLSFATNYGWPGSIRSPDDGQGTPETCRDVLNKTTNLKWHQVGHTHTHTHTHIYIYIFVWFYDARINEPKMSVPVPQWLHSQNVLPLTHLSEQRQAVIRTSRKFVSRPTHSNLAIHRLRNIGLRADDDWRIGK
jgi:hypothetical protein